MISQLKPIKDGLRLIFMGTPEFSVPILNALINQYNIVSVITQPDKPAGRGRKILFSPVKQFAIKNGLMVLQPENLINETIKERIKGIKPDLIIVAAYGKILPTQILKIPKYGCINVHASLLPKWRGASPIQSAILAGDPHTGITIMRMDEGMDTGDILATFCFPIETTDTSLSLGQKLSELGADKLIGILPSYIEGDLELKAQDNEQATYSKLINKSDGRLDFMENADFIERKVRAFIPSPICFMEKADRMIKIHKVEILKECTLKPGETGVSNKFPAVGTNTFDIILREVQPAGKQIMSGKNFLNGARGWID